MRDAQPATNGTAQRSTREVVQEIIGDIQEIVRSEVRLAKTELREEGSKAGMAAAYFGTAGVLLFFSIGLLEAMFVVLWAMKTPLWIALLIMAVISGLTGAVFYALGRDRWRKVHGMPATVATLKEDVQWLRKQSS
jgi:uncharacterized membrane protein YqjE